MALAASNVPPSFRQAIGNLTVAALVAGAVLGTGGPSVLVSAALAVVALVGALWLRPRLRGTESTAALIMAAVVGFHARALFYTLWSNDAYVLKPLWFRLMEVFAIGLVLCTAHPSATELRCLAVVLLAGIPTQPAGFVWATFPVACMLMLSSRTTVGRWSWVLIGWTALELIRAPCRFDAGLTVALVCLACAGVQYGRIMSRKACWLAGMGAMLMLPYAAGCVWSLFNGMPPLPTAGWGVNTNPLAAQTALGVLLLFFWLRVKHRMAAWCVLAAGVGALLPLRSIWAIACMVPLAVAASLPQGRARTWSVIALGLIPFVTPAVAAVRVPWLPQWMAVSYLARQFHWHAAVNYVALHPLGGGLANVHPQALGLVDPAPELAVIPGSQMQHAHHALLHIAEQGGVPLLLAVSFLSMLWIVRFARSVGWQPAGFGVLYLWLNNGADLTLLYEPMVLVGGLLLGLTRQPPRIRRIGLSGLLLPYLAVWLTSWQLLGSEERASRDGSSSRPVVSRIQRTLGTLWGVRTLTDPGAGAGRNLSPHGRCVYATPLLVDRAAALIAEWRPQRAERLLQEAVRRDPTGVITNGGGRARVMLAILQRQTGRGRLARQTIRGLRWADAEATQALATLEYYTLRHQEARVESAVKHVLSTSHDPALLARFQKELRQHQSRSGTVGRTSQDVFKEQVERLLSDGLVADARARLLESGHGLDRWVLTLLWSKVSAAEGDMGKAVALAAQAVAQSGGSDAARWELVGALSASNRTDEALIEVGTLVKRRPRNPGVWLLRAQTLIAAGRAPEAIHDVERARALGGDLMACGIARSQALRLMGRRAEAESLLVGLLRDRPGMSWPAWELASWAESEGRLGDAARWAREALARAPGDHGTRVLLGRVLAAQGRVNEALRQLRLVVEDPRAGPGWQADARREIERLQGRAR